MKIYTQLAIVSLAVLAAGAGPVPAVDPSKVLDLTYTFDAQTVYWPTEKPFDHAFERHGTTAGGYFYSSAKFSAAEHGGTHMDAPYHFNQHGMTADRVPLLNCIGPAAVIDFSARAARQPDAVLTVEDIEKDEAAHGRIPEAAIVVARSGWGKFWPDKHRYLGSAKPGDTANLHFPGYSPEAAAFLLHRRKVAAIAIDTASIDPGASKDFRVHRLWLGADKPAFENLANADKLPPRGATIFCAPMKIGQGTGGPARIFALLP